MIRKSMRLCKILFGVLLTGLLFAGCSKDDENAEPSGDYYFRATLDEVEKYFYTVNFQGGGNDGRWEHITVGGFESRHPTDGGHVPPSLDFEIWKTGGNITPGTYTAPAESGLIARYAIQMDNGTLVYNNANHDDAYTVTIEAISNEGIKGTFSGTLRNMAGQAIIIEDGSFNLPFEEIVNP